MTLAYAAFGRRSYVFRSDSSFRKIPDILYPRSITVQIFWNSIGSLSQTLYLQLTVDRIKYKHPQFFSSHLFLIITLLISNMSSGTSSYIFFKEISCY